MLPPTRVSSQEPQTIHACDSSQEKQLRNSFFSVIHFTFLNAEYKILTVVFSLGKAQCWCNNANSWALTWQCLNLNASLILGKKSWETAGTTFCASLLPPEPCYRVCLRTPKAKTRGLAYSLSPCRLTGLIILPGKQEVDATFRPQDNWMMERVVGTGRQLCKEE